MARAFSVWIVNHPHLVIIVVIALTTLFALGVRHGIEVDVSPLSFTEKTNRGRLDYEASRRDFGDDLYLVLPSPWTRSLRGRTSQNCALLATASREYQA